MRTVFFLFKNLPGHFFNNPVKSSKEVSIVDIPFFSQLISCGEITVNTVNFFYRHFRADRNNQNDSEH